MGALSPGTVVDRYRVEGVIGSGSMGDVVRGVDVDLKRPVAIKILSERHRENDELRARFVREGRAVAAISHPNVVQVFTTGSHDQRPFIAMELLQGVDLGSVIKEHGVMTSIQAARAGLDAARGLEAAFKAGLIHRDVKPSNLVLLESGVVKVTDFGLAKPLDPSSEPALTAMGVVVGTPDYIAPEQARGEAIDERVDIYALGGTLYYLLVGSPPFRTGNPNEDKYLKVVARHLKDPAPEARSKNATIDAELSALTRRMMAKKPAERPTYPALIQSLTGMVDRLGRGGADASQPLVRAGGPSTPEPTPFVAGNRGGAARASTSGPPAPPPRARTRPPTEEEAESAATLLRGKPGSSASHGSPLPVAPPTFSRGLLALTVVAALIFAAGLALTVFGRHQAATDAAAARVPDAARAIDAAPAAIAPPVPPTGMVLVSHPDGSPLAYVDLQPVSVTAFAAVFPERKPARKSKKQNALPITGVSFADAQAFARSQGKRLCHPDEWALATKADGFVPAGELLEWVDDGSRGEQEKRAVRGPDGLLDKKSPGPHPNVGFRLARDL